MKKCFKCGETKPRKMFYRHPAMKDGRLGKCIECTKRDVRLHREQNESVREYDRRRYAENPERRRKIRENSDRWDIKNKNGYIARYTVHNAVRDGRMKRMPCQKCGATDRINAHHEDYSKPLDVIWLCSRCHHRYHAGYT